MIITTVSEAVLVDDDGDGFRLEVVTKPPKGIEEPGADLSNVCIICSESNDPNDWRGCIVRWRDDEWVIHLAISVANSEIGLFKIRRAIRLKND